MNIVADDLFRFTRGRAISKGNDIHLMFFNQLMNRSHCFFHLIFRRSRVNDRRVQYLSGRIDHGNFTAGTEARIPAEHDLADNGRLHKKLC